MKAVRSLALLAGTVLLAGPALAGDPDAAKKLFEDGVKDLEAGRFDEACPALENSYDLAPMLGTLFALAECEAKRGKLAAAVTRYREYLELYARLSPDKKRRQGTREKESRAALAALGPKVAELTLVLPPSAPSVVKVTRDGAQVSRAALGVPFPVDPGEHVITTQAGEGPVAKLRLTLAAGERRAVALDVRSASSQNDDKANPPVIVERAPPPSPARVAGLVTGGVLTLGGLAIGGAFLGVSLSKEATLQEAEKGTDREVAKKVAREKDVATNTALWGFVGAGVAAAGTVAFYFITRPSSQKAPAVKGSLGVTSAGPSILLQGRF